MTSNSPRAPEWAKPVIAAALKLTPLRERRDA